MRCSEFLERNSTIFPYADILWILPPYGRQNDTSH